MTVKEITVSDYLMGRGNIGDLTPIQASNMLKLLSVINDLLADFGECRKVNSGFRRQVDNKAAGGSPNSKHLQAAAIDLEDKNGKLKQFMTEEMLDKYNLYMEHPDATPGWIHLSIIPPKSGVRVFRP